MWIVILGRAISGMGGAGTMTISSVIITGTHLRQPTLKNRIFKLTEPRYRSQTRRCYMESLRQYLYDTGT